MSNNRRPMQFGGVILKVLEGFGCFLICSMIMWGCIVINPAVADDVNPAVLMFEIQGNTHVPAERILGVIANSRMGSPVDTSRVQQDMQAIYNLGYFSDVKASTQTIFDGVKLIFTVVENPFFKEVRISGLTKIQPQELQPFFTQKTDEVFSTKIFQEDLSKALKFCQEKKGFFVRASGNGLPSVSSEGIVQLNLMELKYGKIMIRGLRKTKEAVIRRELTGREGEIIDTNQLQEEMQNLMRLRLFDNLEPKFEVGEAPDTLDLILEAQEGKTGSFSFGGGYSELAGEIGLILGYSESNLRGVGESLSLDVNLAATTKDIAMSFNEPWLDSHHTSFGLSVWNSDTYMDSTMNAWRPDDATLYYMHFVKTGLSLSLGRPIAGDTTASLALIGEKNRILSYFYGDDDDTPGGAPTNGTPLEFWDNGLQLSIVKNRLHYEDRNFVNAGFQLQGAVKVSGKYLGGYFDYQKATLDWKGFQALSPDLVFADRVELAYQNGDCPDYNRLYLGGMMRLRGYSNEMYYNQSLIGDSYWLNNAELRFRLPGNKNIELVLFGDAGQIFENAVPAFKYDYGVGIRLNIPMLGVLRFDQAWNGDNGSQFVFGINEMF